MLQQRKAEATPYLEMLQDECCRKRVGLHVEYEQGSSCRLRLSGDWIECPMGVQDRIELLCKERRCCKAF